MQVGYTPLHEAATSGHEIAINVLINAGAKVNCFSKVDIYVTKE